jgi:hypothetical protein
MEKKLKKKRIITKNEPEDWHEKRDYGSKIEKEQ